MATVENFENTICNDLGVADDETIGELLTNLGRNLDRGRFIPNENCFKMLTTIATKPQLEIANRPEWGSNSLLANRILRNHFYTGFHGAESKEGKEEEKEERWNTGKSSFDYLPTELATPFPGLPGLASLVSGYYSNCALLTQDGAKCGLGNNGGFQYRYQYPSVTGATGSGLTEESYCAQECVTDLCPQWLSTLLTRAPTKVKVEYGHTIFKNYGITKMFEVKVSSVHLRIKGTQWTVSFQDGEPTNLWPETIAAGCRLLGSQRKTSVGTPGNKLEVDINLDKSDPEYLAQAGALHGSKRMRISFPEFPGGYFVDSDLWKYVYAFDHLTATLIIPSLEDYDKMRKMKRQIATQTSLPQSQYLLQSSQPSVLSSLLSSSSSSSMPTTGKRTFTDYQSAQAFPDTFGGGDEHDDDESSRTKTGRFLEDA